MYGSDRSGGCPLYTSPPRHGKKPRLMPWVNLKEKMAHMVSLIVFERCGGGKKNLAHESDSVRTEWRWEKKKNKTKKKPLRRGGWVVHNKDKGVSPESSGGHQFCPFLAYSVILHFINKRKNDFNF